MTLPRDATGPVLDPLFVDASVWQDAQIAPAAWETLAADPRFHGVILKATEGIGGPQAWQRSSAAWFAKHWPAVRTLGNTKRRAHERYGVDFFRGGYHFLLAGHDGAKQADFYLDTIERAGGWGIGDLWPIVDVEEGSGNAALVAARPDGVSMLCRTVEAFVSRVQQRTGRDVVLYAGWWLASLGIRERFGCAWLWYASYTRTLPTAVYERIGWSRDRLLWWQYCGANAQGPLAELAGYPSTTPLGNVDISALTLPGGLAALRAGLWAERPAPSVCAVGPER
jgi:GH25 family lysozyme M1 (1,4-beta-N-acetylmuramidase)